MDDRSRIAEQLRGKNCGASEGEVMLLLARRGRVVVTESAGMSAERLRLVGAGCVKPDDPLSPDLTRRAG